MGDSQPICPAVLIKQTVRRGDSSAYVIDRDDVRGHVEKHVELKNDRAIAGAVKAALRGKL